MIINIATPKGSKPTRLYDAEIVEINGIKMVIHEEIDLSDMEDIQFDATHYESGLRLPECRSKTKDECKEAVKRILDKNKNYNFKQLKTINHGK
jgi:hypothetical protein